MESNNFVNKGEAAEYVVYDKTGVLVYIPTMVAMTQENWEIDFSLNGVKTHGVTLNDFRIKEKATKYSIVEVFITININGKEVDETLDLRLFREVTLQNVITTLKSSLLGKIKQTHLQDFIFKNIDEGCLGYGGKVLDLSRVKISTTDLVVNVLVDDSVVAQFEYLESENDGSRYIEFKPSPQNKVTSNAFRLNYDRQLDVEELFKSVVLVYLLKRIVETL